MKVSVIIVTKDRPDDIELCLTSVRQQSHDWHQVIIIDASTESTPSTTLSIVEKFYDHIPITYIPAEPGITKQRNIGRSHVLSDTDVVLYIDDDVVLPTNAVSELQKAFSQYPNAIGITGKIIGEEPHGFFKRLFGRFTLVYTGKVFGITKGVFNIINIPTKTELVSWLPGAFMACRWSAVKDIEFDEWFTTYGLGEDLDFSLRVAKKGELYVYPQLLIEHRHSATGRDWKRFGYMRIKNRRYILQKHFRKNIGYQLGYLWSNAWLMIINAFRALSSSRYRDELSGQIKAFLQK